MSSGIALTDDDRAGWLAALARRIRQSSNAGTGIVISCSALKRPYRDILREKRTTFKPFFCVDDLSSFRKRNPE
jgi:carbohydrate kinase (thermoresistant glucokinase family)